MEDLIGLQVKITLISGQGFAIVSGEVLSVREPFVVIQSNLGPMYVSYYSIKTIQIEKAQHETK